VIEVREEVLRQATALRDKQDARRATQQQRSALIAGGATTVGAIITAVIASPAANANSGQVIAAGVFVVALALANGVCWGAVYKAASKWLDGPDIDTLTRNYSNRYDGHRALIDYLIAVHNDHRGRNEEAVDSAARVIALQMIATFGGASLLVVALLALG